MSSTISSSGSEVATADAARLLCFVVLDIIVKLKMCQVTYPMGCGKLLWERVINGFPYGVTAMRYVTRNVDTMLLFMDDHGKSHQVATVNNIVIRTSNTSLPPVFSGWNVSRQHVCCFKIMNERGLLDI